MDDAEKKAGDLSKKLSSLGSSMQKTGGMMTAGLTVPIVAGLTAAVNSASNLEQSMGGVESVFGASGEVITKFGETSAEAVGLSKRSFNELSTVGGALLQNLGFDTDGAANEMITLAQRGSDVAATFGGPVANVLAAVNSALKGEFNPLEQFGVKMNQAGINAKAMEMGLADSNGEINDSAKAQAALALFYEQTAKTQGQFARESDTLAGATERLKAKFEDQSAALGQQLLPLAVKLAGWISNLIDKFSALSPSQQKTIVIVLALAAAIGPLLVIIGSLLTAVTTISTFLAGPAVAAVGAFLLPFLPLIAIIAAVIAIVLLLRAAWVNNWGDIQGKTTQAVEFVKSKISSFVNTIKNLWDGMLEKFENIDWENLGRDIILGLMRGLAAMASNLWSAVKGIADGVKNFFTGLLGISSPSKVFLGYGENIMRGLANGIKTSINLPTNELSKTGLVTPGVVSGGSSGMNSPNIFKVAITINGNADENNVRNGVRLGIGDAMRARGAS